MGNALMTMADIVTLPLGNTLSREQWAVRINNTWQHATEAVIETGTLITQAKQQLPHGEFMTMVERDLPVSVATCEKLMRIANHPVLQNRAHVPILPGSWATLYQLALMEEPMLLEKLKDGSITPATTKRDVIGWRKPKSRLMTTTDKPTRTDTPTKRRPSNFAGCKIKVPEGHTLSSLIRVGLALEQQEGISPSEAAKRVKLAIQSYRQARDIVQLADRTDLKAADKDLAQRALAILDDTRQVMNAFAMVRDIARHVWGGKGNRRNERSVERRLEMFKTALTIMVEACSRGHDIEVPHLSTSDIRTALGQIAEAQEGLRKLAAKLKGEMP